MQSVFSRVSVRHYAAHPTARGYSHAVPRFSPLIADVAGELEAIHPHAPRHVRIVGLESLRDRHSDALALRWNALRGAGMPSREEDEDPDARDEPRALSALHTVLHEGARLLDLYDAHPAPDDAPHMKSEWAQALQKESAQTVAWLLTQGCAGAGLAATYAAAMQPALRDDFLGGAWHAAGAQDARPAETLPRMIENRVRDQAFEGLSKTCLLALRLYAHPDSGAFNLVRACADLRKLFPGRAVGRCVDEIPALVHAAVSRLHELPSARVWGTLYKGMQSGRGSDWQAGDEIAIDRPFSVTAMEGQSYAGRLVKGARYDQELRLTDSRDRRTQAVMIAAFHPPSTAPQGEAVILPGQVYRLQDSQWHEEPAKEGGSLAIVRLMAQKVGDRPVESA